MGKPVIWTTQEDAIKHLQAQAPGKYIAIRDQAMAQSADAIMRLVQKAVNWAKDPGVAVVLAWCVDALVMTVFGAPVVVSAPFLEHYGFRSAPPVADQTTAPIKRADLAAHTAPRLFTDRAAAEESLRLDWPKATVKNIEGRFAHLRSIGSLAQVRDMVAAAIASGAGAGALDLAAVMTWSPTVEDTLMITILGAFET